MTPRPPAGASHGAGSAPARTAAAAEAGPSVLVLDLGAAGRGAVAHEPRFWSSSHAGVDRVGRLGGAGLAAALVHDAAPSAAAPCLAVAVGPAVVDGVPTAARATVAGAPAPRTGRHADGQVGGELAVRLAALVDGVLLCGRAGAAADVGHDAGAGPRAGAVLVLSGRRGRVTAELRAWPELAGASPARAHEALVERLGPCATLAVGPAGERGAAAASLAVDGRHFVGRGGLGAILGALGLKALAVLPTAEGAPGRRSTDAGREDARARLVRWLTDSPRLRVRSEQGSLELYGDLAARGDGGAAALAREAEGRGAGREGCRGCPTPCGWVFETPRGARAGHFAANRALGSELGVADLAGSLELLAACDAAGLDAKEVGPALAAWCAACERGALARPSPRGDVEALRALVADAGAGREPAALLARGASAAARALDVDDAGGRSGAAREPGAHRPRVESGSPVEPAEPVERVAARVGGRGGDPMRVFPFLVGTGAGPAALAARVAPLALPEGADDPRRLAGKGRLAWWHESFVAALDAEGFCAFSAAGLLADGVARLDELAAVLAGEPTAGAGLRFLARGAALCHLHRAIDARLAADAPASAGPLESAAPADGELAAELADYARLRGVDARGRPTPAASERFARGLDPVDLTALAAELPPGAARAGAGGETDRSNRTERGWGRVHLRAAGALARALGGERIAVELELPAPLQAVLAEAARGAPEPGWIARGGEPLPTAYRAGRRVGPDEAVRDGDELDLVLALRGG